MRTHVINLLILAITTTAMIFLYGRMDYTSKQFEGWDLHDYRKMAAASPHLATDVSRPFGYRIGGPYLVGLVPQPIDTTFYLFAIVASYAVVGLFYGFLSFVGLSPPIAAISTFLFTTNKYFFGLTVWDYFQINNLLCQSLIVVMFWAMLSDRWKTFAAALFVAAFIREVSMMLIPVAALRLWEQNELRRRLPQFVLLVLPAVIVFVLLRVFIPTVGGDTLVDAIKKNVPLQLTFESMFRWLVNSFAPLTLVPLVFFDSTIQFFRERKFALLFLLLVSTSLCFGTDTELLMAPTFIVFYWLIGTILQEYRWDRISLGLVIVACAAASMHHTIARFPLPTKQATMIVSVGALLLVTFVAVIRAHPRQTFGSVGLMPGDYYFAPKQYTIPSLPAITNRPEAAAGLARNDPPASYSQTFSPVFKFRP